MNLNIFIVKLKIIGMKSTMTRQVDYGYDVNMQYSEIKYMLIYISSHQNYTNLEYRK